jgi:hypothetical protein
MAVAIDIEFKGATIEQYDQSVERMGFTPGGKHRPGCLFHWVTKTDDGFRVVDVWEAREQFDRFVDEEVAPAGEALGMGQPEMKFSEVHNYLTAG